MPFNFPIEQNRFGDLFAQGIANAINTYRQGQQIQRQKTLTELQNPGFHFGNMPTVGQYSRQLPNATTEPTSVDTSVVLPGQDAALTPKSTPLHITSPSVSVSQPNQFQSTISTALASMPKNQRNAPASTVDSSYIPLSGGYLNTNELIQRLLPQMQLQARGKYLESAAQAAGTAAGNPAAQDRIIAETNLANRNAGALRLGDPNYAGAMGQVAGAQEAAKAPILTNTAVNIAKGELPTKEALQQNQGDIEYSNQSRLIPLRVKAELAAPMYGLAAAKAFDNDKAVSALTAGVPLYGQAKVALAQARAGNPAALESALLNFATSADPKGQLRQGLVKIETRINPSFSGNAEQAIQALAHGKLRTTDIDNMESIIDQVHTTNKAFYKQRRDAYVKSNPAAAPVIPDEDTAFDVPGIKSGASKAKGPYDDLP